MSLYGLSILPNKALIPEVRTSVTEFGVASQLPKKVPETPWKSLTI
jgi:hypothetical protein